MAQEIYINKGGRFGQFLVSDGTNLTWSKTQATVFLYQPDNVITDKNSRVVCLDELGNFVYGSEVCYYDQELWKSYGYIYSTVQKSKSVAIGMASFFGVLLFFMILMLIMFIRMVFFAPSSNSTLTPDNDFYSPISSFLFPGVMLLLLAAAVYGFYYFLNQTIRLSKLSDPLV